MLFVNRTRMILVQRQPQESVRQISYFRNRKRHDRQIQRERTVRVYATENTKRADRVYAWGRANTGALGVKGLVMAPQTQHGSISNRSFPVRLSCFDELDVKVRKAACGVGFSVMATNSSDDMGFVGTGINTDSQLGYQESAPDSRATYDILISPVPVKLPVGDDARVVDVSCGRAHVLALTDQGSVLTLGHNGYGQCGRPVIKEEVYSGSQKVHKLCAVSESPVRSVHAGMDHSMLITEAGELFAFGFGTDFQTGLNAIKNVHVPEKVRGDLDDASITTVSSKADTNLALSGNTLFIWQVVPVRTTDDGTVFGWGNNEYRQLGPLEDKGAVRYPKELNLAQFGVGKVVSIFCGGCASVVVDEEGHVFAWGFGLLGFGPEVERLPEPKQLPATLFGRNDLNPKSKVVSVSGGTNYMAALTDSGDIYTWGKNTFGQLGLGHLRDQFFPFRVALPAEAKSLACGHDHMIALAKAFS